MPRKWKARADREAGDNQAAQQHEADDADGPSESDGRNKPLKEDRQNDSSTRAATRSETDCERASLAEPVAEYCDGRIEPARE